MDRDVIAAYDGVEPPPNVSRVGRSNSLSKPVTPGLRTVGACFAVFFVSSFAAPAFETASDTSRRVDFGILEDYDKNEDLGDVAKDFDLFRQLGVTTWRGSFGWDDYEPSRGHYDFDWLHRFADLAESRDITLRPYIGYTPAWAAVGGSDKDV
jgi:glycosyl hydrolase family 42 (putative beta-galactosidase)